MAYRECLGEGVRAIARGTGSGRKTIAKYVAAAVAAGLARGTPGPRDEHIAAVPAAVRAPRAGRPGEVPDRLAAKRDQIAEWLGEGLRLTKTPPGPLDPWCARVLTVPSDLHARWVALGNL